MTVQWGDTGKSYTGVLRTFTMNQPNPRESLSGSPTALPTANPGSASAQVSFMVQQSDLPTMTPDVNSKAYCAYVIVGGKNTDAASQTVNSQIYQNGASKGTANNSVPSNTFWTHNLYYINNVSVGDVINVAMWATSANVNFDYSCLMVFMTRILYVPRQSIMTGINITGASDKVPTLGTPSSASSAAYYVTFSASNAGGLSTSSVGNMSIDTLKAMHTTNNFIQSYFDQQQTSYTLTDTTNRPRYRTPYYPKTVSFREIGRW